MDAKLRQLEREAQQGDAAAAAALRRAKQREATVIVTIRNGGEYTYDHYFVISMMNAWHLKGMTKRRQAEAICAAAGIDTYSLMDEPYEGVNWNVMKSRNLAYHPATYTLTISMPSTLQPFGWSTIKGNYQVINSIEYFVVERS